LSPEEAEKILRPRAEYKWLTESGVQFWTVTDVAKNLNIGGNAIRVRCEDKTIKDAIFYGTQLGWRIPRSSLLVYLAELVIRKSSDAG